MNDILYAKLHSQLNQGLKEFKEIASTLNVQVENNKHEIEYLKNSLTEIQIQYRKATLKDVELVVPVRLNRDQSKQVFKLYCTKYKYVCIQCNTESNKLYPYLLIDDKLNLDLIMLCEKCIKGINRRG